MRKRFAIGLLAAAIVLGLAVAKRHELLRGALVAGAGLAGYQLRIGGLHVDRDEAVIAGLSVARASQPLLAREAHRGALLPARSLSGQPASLRTRRRRRGRHQANAYSISRRQLRYRVAGRAGAAGRPATRSMRCRCAFMRAYATRKSSCGSRRLSTKARARYASDGINGEASVDSAAVTSYRLAGAFEERRREPFTVRGRIDMPAGFATHHAKAARFPLRALSNYFAQSPDVRILHGGASNFDAVVYALGLEAGVAAVVSREPDARRARCAALPSARSRFRSTASMPGSTSLTMRFS